MSDHRSTNRDLEDTRKRLLELQANSSSSSDCYHGQVKVYEGTIRELEGKLKTMESQCTKLREDWSHEK